MGGIMLKEKALVWIFIIIILAPTFINADVIDRISCGVYGRLYYGNTGEWFQIDPRINEYYNLQLSFGFYAQAFFNPIIGVEAGLFTWNGEYQNGIYLVYDRHSGAMIHEITKFDLNSVSPYLSVVISPLKHVFLSVGKYFSGRKSLENYFFLRCGVKFPITKGRLPVSLIGFGDYYLNKNDGENFWTLNLGVQLN